METGNHFGVSNLAGTSVQNFLSTAGNGEKTAFPGTFGFKIIVFKLRGKLTSQKILKCDARAVPFIVGWWKCSYFMQNFYMQARRRCKRVSLYMVN